MGNKVMALNYGLYYETLASSSSKDTGKLDTEIKENNFTLKKLLANLDETPTIFKMNTNKVTLEKLLDKDATTLRQFNQIYIHPQTPQASDKLKTLFSDYKLTHPDSKDENINETLIFKKSG